jgi:hypothetical protein
MSDPAANDTSGQEDLPERGFAKEQGNAPDQRDCAHQDSGEQDPQKGRHAICSACAWGARWAAIAWALPIFLVPHVTPSLYPSAPCAQWTLHAGATSHLWRP